MSETATVGIGNVSAAYVAAFAEMTNAVKDRSNPHLGNDYATLESVLAAVRPVLAKHKLAVYQAPGEMTVMSPDLATISVVTVLLHASGEQISIRTQVPVAPGFDKRSGKSVIDAQRAGSAITYARRYALAAVCGITQTDDDGNDASAGSSGEDDKEHLAAAIKTAATAADLAAIKERVRAAGDRKLIQAWVKRNGEFENG